MGLDSVEIVMAWEEAFGIAIEDAECAKMFTPRIAIDFIAAKLNAVSDTGRPCLTLRAFHRLRHAISTAAGVPRAMMRPKARLKDLIPTERQTTWEAVRSTYGFPDLPGMGWFSSPTIGGLALWIVANALKDLKRADEPWTRTEIRTVVRAVITHQSGVEDFSDDAEFARDLCID